MKKEIWHTIILLLFGTCVSVAQNFRGGYTIGFTASQIHGDKLEGFNHPTLKVGAFTELKRRRRKKGTGGLEMNFQGKGSSTGLDVPAESTKRVNLYYLDFVPYYRYRVGKKIFLKAGIPIAYFLTGNINFYGVKNDLPKDTYRKVSVDGLIGISTAISKKMYFQVEGQMSLLPFTKKLAETPLFKPTGLQHRMLSFSVYSLF
jgi:hypothetical protein